TWFPAAARATRGGSSGAAERDGGMIADLLPVDGFDTDPEEVRSRIAEARRRGEPAWLWPEVSPSDWRRALKAIEGVVSALLREENHAVLPEIPNRVLSLA